MWYVTSPITQTKSIEWIFSFAGSAFLLQSENVLVQSKRFRGKINIQRPKPPHYERALFNAVTEPIYPKTPLVVDCRQKQLEILKIDKTKNNPNQFELILARELRQEFDENEMVLICHMNSQKAYDLFQFKVALHQFGVRVKIHGPRVRRAVLEGHKYENLLKLMDVSHCMLFGHPSSIGDVLKVLKKTRQMILLAGAMSDRILSKDQLVEYSKLPDLQVVRAQFAATLTTAGGQIVNYLQAHQSNLCYLLDAHAKALGDTAAPKPTTDDASAAPAETKTE